MSNIIAQFIHQRKDKVIYESVILQNSMKLKRVDGRYYLYFFIPSLFDEPKWHYKWCEINFLASLAARTFVERDFTTWRTLRFVDSDGTILYSLSDQLLHARLALSAPQGNWRAWGKEISCLVTSKDIAPITQIIKKLHLT